MIESLAQSKPIELSILHATTPENAARIMDHGFDMRHYGQTSKKTKILSYYNTEPKAIYAIVANQEVPTQPPPHPWIHGQTGTWVAGTVRLKKPVWIAMHNEDGVPWFEVLSKRYGGKTKAQLASALMRDGYDGVIVTMNSDPTTVAILKPESIRVKRTLPSLKAEANKPDSPRLEDMPTFKKWFGKSRVVDQNGKPLRVYKAMFPEDLEGRPIKSIQRQTEFPAFNQGEPGVRVAGFFGSKEIANRFSEPFTRSTVFPVYLSFQKPYVIDAKGDFAGNIQFGQTGHGFRDAIRSGKYDSVIIYNTKDEGDVYVALKANQIKSAIGNRGTFGKASDDITETSSFSR